jgi:hypothetical protein
VAVYNSQAISADDRCGPNVVGEIRINIYLLGKDADGKVCGLRTLSVVI